MISFVEYIAFREGLWLNDKNAVVGLSKIAPPKPPEKARQPAPPRIKTVHTSAPAKPVGEVQLPDALTMMGQMGIALVEPDRDQMRRLVDKAKKRAIVPQPPQPPAAPLGAIPPPAASPQRRPEPPPAGAGRRSPPGGP